jgi:hypothetical protein
LPLAKGLAEGRMFEHAPSLPGLITETIHLNGERKSRYHQWRYTGFCEAI